MEKAQTRQAFTLVELMIVVAIISVLTMVAIPAYQTYMARAKTTEGLTLAARAKVAVMEFALHSHGKFPSSNAELGLPEKIAGTYVENILVGSRGAITIRYKPLAGSKRHDTLILKPVFDQDAVSWQCEGGSLPSNFRPAVCRKHRTA